MTTYPPLVPALFPRAEVRVPPIATRPGLKRLGAGLNAPFSAHTPRCQSDVEVRVCEVGGDGEVFADDGEGMHESSMDAMGKLGDDSEEVIDFRTSLP
jgi:hypothetical protein